MKKDLILLHGALGSERQMLDLKNTLNESFNVFTMSFEGHGDRSSTYPLEVERFAMNLKDFIADKNLSQPNIFGYSMGGYVALFTEAKFPNLLGRIMTLGTKFNWTPESAVKEVRMLNPDVIEEKVPHFAEHLDRMHTPNSWKTNMRKTAEMMLRMGDEPPLNAAEFAAINQQVLLSLGGKDQMVSQEETKQVLNQLPNASFHLFDSLEHPLDRIDTCELSETITGYFY